MPKNRQTSETFLLGALLALVGGFLDAYTYIDRGGVFANAQTGSIVLLGLRLADGRFADAMKYLVPIFAFAAGVVIAAIIRHRYQTNVTRLHWRQIVIAFEIAILAALSFTPHSEQLNMLTNVLVSFVCSLQVQSFRKLNGSAYATTMCTGNLRSAAECLYTAAAHQDHAELRRGMAYLGIIAAFIAGAVLGAWLTHCWGSSAMLAACGALAAVFGLMFVEHR